MNARRYITVVVVFVAMLLAMLLARVAGASVITFNENGQGTIQLNSGAVIPLVPLGNIPDPVDPTNGLLPLVYDLAGSVGLASTPPVPGDMNVLEQPLGTPPSDLLRWTPNGLLVVYSDRPEPGETPDLADVGLPALRQTNLITRVEVGPENGLNGVFGYAPTPNQPGFFTNSTGDTPTYNFISDTPEPATAGVASIAGLALLRRHRGRRRR
jgi:hypothetical protein